MQTPHIFTPLLVVVGLALIVPLVLVRMTWLRLPIVVGEILAGIVVGRSGLDLVTHEDALLHVLSELGFVFLMFLSGMEVDFSSLSAPRAADGTRRTGPWGPLPLAAISFLLTLSLSAVAGFAFWRSGLVGNPWMVALILSTTSLGVVVPVLKEQGLATSRFGQTLVVAALVADFLTMLLITVVVAVLSGGAGARVLLLGVLCAMVFLVYRLGLAINRAEGLRRLLSELSHATAQIKVRAAFALMLVFVALSEAMGTEVILGAFLAGSVVAALKTEDDERFHDQLEGVGFGFFIPVFFIMVGVQFHLPSLFESRETVWLLPLLLVAALLVKVVPGLVFRLAFSWREALGAGVLLSARLSLIIAAAAIGRQLGLISDPVNAAVILVAIVTVTMTPSLFLHLVPGFGRGSASRSVVSGVDTLNPGAARGLRAHLEDVDAIDPDERGMPWSGGGWGPEAPYARMFDAATIETVTGTILNLDRLAPLPGMTPGVHLALETRQGNVSVHLGPVWYVGNQDVGLEPGEQVRIRGSRITLRDKPAVLAVELTKGQDVLRLRDENGLPLWCGWRRR